MYEVESKVSFPSALLSAGFRVIRDQNAPLQSRGFTSVVVEPVREMGGGGGGGS